MVGCLAEVRAGWGRVVVVWLAGVEDAHWGRVRWRHGFAPGCDLRVRGVEVILEGEEPAIGVVWGYRRFRLGADRGGAGGAGGRPPWWEGCGCCGVCVRTRVGCGGCLSMRLGGWRRVLRWRGGRLAACGGLWVFLGGGVFGSGW